MQFIPRDGVKLLFQAFAAYREFGPLNRSKKAGNRGITGIPSGCDADQSIQGCQAGCVKNEPLASDVSFETGMEVLGIELIGVDGDIARWDGEGAAEGDPEMGEVSANPLPEGAVTT